MKCAEIRTWIFRKIDGELSESGKRDFDNHIEHCPDCARAYRITALPRRMASGISTVSPSPFFYGKLKIHLENEKRSMAGWQLFWRLARQMVPALAGITLALLTALAFIQLQGPKTDLPQDYRRVFITEGQPHRMLSGEQGDITDASVLRAIAERQSGY